MNNTKIIDIHTHTFPQKIAQKAIDSLKSKSHTISFTNGTIEQLAQSMLNAGINYSVIQPVATNPKQVIHVNDSSIEINEKFNDTGIMSFGCMHPDFENYDDELKRIKDSGIKGIKLHPVYQGVNIDDMRYINILRKSSELGLIVLIHAGYDIGFPGNDEALPYRINNALKESGNVKVILAHMGGWRSWKEAEIFADNENVFIDTAFSLGEFVPLDDGYYVNDEECRMLNENEFLAMIKKFGAEKIIFGTDSPWASQIDTLNKINALSLTDSEKKKIFFGNAKTLMNL